MDARVFDTLVRSIDQGAWSYLMKESGLMTFMDAKARTEWAQQLSEPGKIPEFTKENVEATFAALYAARAEMFGRGVIQCFKNLSWDYRTHQPFRFGKRIIVERLFSYAGKGTQGASRVSYFRANELDDLIRVFHVLDGRPEPDHRQGMYHVLDRASAVGNEWEGEYMHVRWFKKGTGHVTFKRLDLIDRLNEILAKHYPGALPDGRRGEERS